MNAQNLERLFHHKGKSPRLLVLGDLILDRYIWGNTQRVSPEAPVLVLNADDCELRPGGASSVAALLSGFECQVVPVGIIGDDTAARQLLKLLDEIGIDSTSLIHIPDRPTTTKERFVGRAAGRHPHQILRVDTETTTPVGTDTEDILLKQVVSHLHSCDALLVSDYAKGVCTPRVLAETIKAGSRRRIPVIVDPARITDYSLYRGADVITPNRTEAELASGRRINTPADAEAVARELCQRFSLGAAIITLDRDGMVFASSAGESGHFSTRPRDVYDITGAGDMVLAMLGLTHAAQRSLRESIPLANIAAGLEVERVGVAQITQFEIAHAMRNDTSESDNKLVSRAAIQLIADRYRSQGKTIVFTNGCFDLLHVGHVHCLQEAAQLGDVLLVAVNCDTIIRQLKGPNRPIIDQYDRATMLSALACVDHVIVFEEETPHRLLNLIRPDVLFKGGTSTEVVGEEVVKSYGGKVRLSTSTFGTSTTSIVSCIADAPSIAGSSALASQVHEKDRKRNSLIERERTS